MAELPVQDVGLDHEPPQPHRQIPTGDGLGGEREVGAFGQEVGELGEVARAGAVAHDVVEDLGDLLALRGAGDLLDEVGQRRNLPRAAGKPPRGCSTPG